jgi:hypothetical protein
MAASGWPNQQLGGLGEPGSIVWNAFYAVPANTTTVGRRNGLQS